MKQNNQNPQKILKRNRFFKIFIPIIGIVLAITAFVVGGSLAGWDILGWLKSPTAFLIYGVVIAIVGVIAFRKLLTRNKF